MIKLEFDTAPAQWPWHFPGNGEIAYVTGGFGFIGSHLVKLLLKLGNRVVVIDAVTYAARPKAVRKVAHAAFTEENFGGYHEEVVDIRSAFGVSQVFQKYGAGDVYHLAAESHVCRSISAPEAFVDSNILGTFNVLQAFRQMSARCQNALKEPRFVHVSTDEVFGELAVDEPAFTEASQVKPRSPYAASKAASDHLALSFFHTYGLPVIVTNCSNNYGPNQNEEKLIPQTIARLLEKRPVRLYGDGSQRRDWLWVGDHVRALAMLVSQGTPGERYCIGGGAEKTNLETVHCVRRAMERYFGDDHEVAMEILHTTDRPTDDKRYAIDASKLKQIGWRPTRSFEEHLEETVKHYVESRP